MIFFELKIQPLVFFSAWFFGENSNTWWHVRKTGVDVSKNEFFYYMAIETSIAIHLEFKCIPYGWLLPYNLFMKKIQFFFFWLKDMCFYIYKNNPQKCQFLNRCQLAGCLVIALGIKLFLKMKTIGKNWIKL